MVVSFTKYVWSAEKEKKKKKTFYITRKLVTGVWTRIYGMNLQMLFHAYHLV